MLERKKLISRIPIAPDFFVRYRRTYVLNNDNSVKYHSFKRAIAIAKRAIEKRRHELMYKTDTKNSDRAERHDLKSRLWLFFSPFLFPP